MCPNPVENELLAAKAAALRNLSLLTHPPRQKPRRRGGKRQHRKPQPESPVEYVPEPLVDVSDVLASCTDEKHREAVREIGEVMKRFAAQGQPESSERENQLEKENANGSMLTGQEATGNEKEQGQDTKEVVDDGNDVISRKRQKEQRRKLIARLKEMSERPDLIDTWDVTSPDPLLLAHLKAVSGSVAVPAHWRQKRKYLQNKRGMEKRAYQLPAYIADTGVGELRDAQIAAEEKKTLKQRQRERMRAKTGRGVEIDHARLHDAFFKFQTKPRLTKHGELYYELKELEVDSSKFYPGVLGDELLAALGIGKSDPPPWLINMQRYGPPPGYPGLDVPGVNVPIPQNGRFGYHEGGWGRVPVDGSGRPIYGDVFEEGWGKRKWEADRNFLWGEQEAAGRVEVDMKDTGSESEEDDDDRNETDSVRDRRANISKEEIEKEARRRLDEQSNRARKGTNRENGPLYEIIPERSVAAGSGMLTSSHVYDIRDGSSRKRSEDVPRRHNSERESAAAPQEKIHAKKTRQFKF